MKRTLVLLVLLTISFAIGHAQYASNGRPRLVSALPATPCVERDFIQDSTTHLTYICQNQLWAELATGDNTGTGDLTPSSVTAGESNSTSVVTGLGNGPLTGVHTLSNWQSGSLYLGAGGLLIAQNTSGSGQAVDATGVAGAVRISATSADNFTSIAEALPAFYGTLRALSGAAGAASNASVFNGQITNSAATFTFTNATFFRAQSVVNSGTLTHLNGFWTPKTGFNGVGTNTHHMVIGSDTMPTGNYALYDNSGYKSLFSGQTSIVPITAIAGDGTEAFFKVTGTIPSTLTGAVNGAEIAITGASSGASGAGGLQTNLLAGYTGSGISISIGASNASAGTGNDFVAGAFNAGVNATASATTAGDNVGVNGIGRGGNTSIGVAGKSIVNKTSGVNVGVAGFGVNTGTTPVQLGGYFGLQATKPTFTSAALMADNGASTDPIFVARDNGTPVVTVADGGAVTLTSSLAIGSGTAILKHLSATATLNFASLVAIGCEDLTMTVTGAAVGDTVALGVPNASVVTNGTFFGWVSATDTVSVKFCTVVSGDPASGTFRADVWQH